MKRKIKFRVWDEESKKMYCGCDAIVTFSGYMEEVYVRNKNTVDELIDYKLMQYTGLTDSNDIEIYEGDILIYRNNKFQIKFEVGSFMLVRISQETDMYELFENCWNDDVYPISQYWWNGDLDSNMLDGLEVIGNIYENPEILKNLC